MTADLSTRIEQYTDVTNLALFCLWAFRFLRSLLIRRHRGHARWARESQRNKDALVGIYL